MNFSPLGRFLGIYFLPIQETIREYLHMIKTLLTMVPILYSAMQCSRGKTHSKHTNFKQNNIIENIFKIIYSTSNEIKTLNYFKSFHGNQTLHTLKNH